MASVSDVAFIIFRQVKDNSRKFFDIVFVIKRCFEIKFSFLPCIMKLNFLI